MADENFTSNPGAGAAGGQDPISGAKAHVRDAANEIRGAAEAKARELREAAEGKAREIRGRAEEMYGDARQRAGTFQDDGEAFVREQPLKAVAYALAAGFVLGALFRR